MSPEQTVWMHTYAAVIAALAPLRNGESWERCRERAVVEANMAVKAFREVNP